MQRYCEALIGPALECRVNLGLYSITLNNDPIADERMLHAYIQFAHIVGEIEGFDHLLEVFLPNIKLPGMDEEKRGMYVADSIVRTMSYLRKHQRPRFIKTAYTTADVWTELCQFGYDVSDRCALGGPRQNARSTFALAHNVARQRLDARSYSDAPSSVKMIRLALCNACAVSLTVRKMHRVPTHHIRSYCEAPVPVNDNSDSPSPVGAVCNRAYSINQAERRFLNAASTVRKTPDPSAPSNTHIPSRPTSWKLPQNLM